MNTRRIFWKIFYGNRQWSSKRFKIQICHDTLSDDFIYLGITVFGFSLLYSDIW